MIRLFAQAAGCYSNREVDRRRLLVIALWTSALAGGWWAGHSQRRTPANAPVAARVVGAPREWTDEERVKRVAELLGHRLAVGDQIEIDDHLAAVSLETLRSIYDRKAEPGAFDFFELQKDADPWENERVEKIRRLAFEAWCRRDPFDFINRHPDPVYSQMNFPIRQAAIKDPHRTMRFIEQSSGQSSYSAEEFFRALAEYYPDLALQAARASREGQTVDWVARTCTQQIRGSAQRWEWAEMVHYRRKEEGEDAVRDILGLIAKDDPDFLRNHTGQGVLAAYPDAVPGEHVPPLLPPPRKPLVGEPLPALKDGLLPENPNPGPHEGPTIIPGRRWGRWFVRDPDAAMTWLDTIKHPKQREEMLDAIVRAAVEDDLQSLDQLLPRLTNPDEHKAAISMAVAILENQESYAALQRFVNRYPGAMEEVYDPAILNP